MSLLEYKATYKRPWWKVPLAVLVAMVGLWVFAIGYIVSQEANMIFLAPATFGGNTPADHGVPFDDVHIPVDGKSYVDAWWISANTPSDKVLLYFHGNAEVLSGETAELELFRQTGYNLLFVDYRGYGRSSPLDTTGATTAADARAALKYLEQTRHIPASDIVLCGWSVGTAVAAQLALESPNVGGLILISPITSVADVANQEWIFRYPLRPVQWLRHDNDMATKDKIASVHMPVLIMTGNEDTLARPWMACELFMVARDPKTLRFIKGADHITIMHNEGGMTFQAIDQFLHASAYTAHCN